MRFRHPGIKSPRRDGLCAEKAAGGGLLRARPSKPFAIGTVCRYDRLVTAAATVSSRLVTVAERLAG
jgi:hypothetical protein